MVDRSPQRKGNDLIERTYKFADSVRDFALKFPWQSVAYSDIKQVVRSSGSVVANYVEAQDASSKKDFRSKAFISLREAKESLIWLRLLHRTTPTDMQAERVTLLQEAKELSGIFTAIVKNSANTS